MNLQINRSGFDIGVSQYESIEALEEDCFYNPELEEEFDRLMYLRKVREEIDSYYIMAELEYDDVNKDMCGVLLGEFDRCHDDEIYS